MIMNQLTIEFSSKPTNLPNNWIITTIEDVFAIQSGYAFKSSNYLEKGIPLIRISNIQKGKISFNSDTVFLDKTYTKTYSDFLVYDEDILVALSGYPGKAAIFNSDHVALLNQRVARIRPYVKKETHSKFIFYFLTNIENEILNKSYGMAQLNISPNKLKNWKFPFPPLNEQKRIVSKIEELFSLINSNTKCLEILKKQILNYQKSFLIEAFSGDLTKNWRTHNTKLDGHSLLNQIKENSQNHYLKSCIEAKKDGKRKPKKPFYKSTDQIANNWNLPSTWSITDLGNIVQTSGGMQKTPARKPVKNFFPYLRVGNVYRNYLNLAVMKNFEISNDELTLYKLKYGDVLIVEGNGSRKEIGRSAIWKEQIPNCVHQNHIIRCRSYNGIHGEFIVNYLNSPKGIEQIFFVASSTSGLYTLSTNKVNNIPIPVPPSEEQKIISKLVEQQTPIIRQNFNTIQETLLSLNQLKQSILKQAFEGKLVPQDPNDEPAEILLQKIKQEKERIEQKQKIIKVKAPKRRRKNVN